MIRYSIAVVKHSRIVGVFHKVYEIRYGTAMQLSSIPALLAFFVKQ